ncbi:MAG: IclR family transcriptional regulator C-terminal domain-containing protein, partial [Bacteroidales bacterium]|nr:IclR family transcriptional regulator C-terminal domain-containing protein [Bacteroidales bacterium]
PEYIFIDAGTTQLDNGGAIGELKTDPALHQDLILSKTNFEKYTKNTLSSAKDIIKELESIKEQGYAIDNEEREEGVTCIAAPIFDCYGEAIASISISGPTYRLKEKGIDSIINNVILISEELSLSLGYIED